MHSLRHMNACAWGQWPVLQERWTFMLWSFSTWRERAVTPRSSAITGEHHITPAVMNYGDTVTRRETCHWKLLHCHWGWHTTDSQQQTHTHLNIFIIFCFSNSCAPRPIRNTDSSLCIATAPFITVYSFTIYVWCPDCLSMNQLQH